MVNLCRLTCVLCMTVSLRFLFVRFFVCVAKVTCSALFVLKALLARLVWFHLHWLQGGQGLWWVMVSRMDVAKALSWSIEWDVDIDDAFPEVCEIHDTLLFGIGDCGLPDAAPVAATKKVVYKQKSPGGRGNMNRLRRRLSGKSL